MSFYSIVVLDVVAVVLQDAAEALSKEELNAIGEALMPIVDRCAKEYDVTRKELRAAKETHSIDHIKPCFLACVFKKSKFMDASGKYDPEASMEEIKKFMHDAEDLKGAAEVAERCPAVNDADVSDGDKGCDRAKLLADCFGELKQHQFLLF